MRPVTADLRGTVLAWVLSLCVSNGAVFAFQVQPKAQGDGSSQTLELSEVDLFSYPDWKSSQITVYGFHLGMSRKEGIHNASTRDLRISSALPDDRKESCRLCRISSLRGYTGIVLDFGADDRVSGIDIDFDVAGLDPKVQRALVSKKFLGKTRQLALHYTEALRVQLLGPESHKTEKAPPGPPPLVQIYEYKYEYWQRGLILNVNLFGSATQARPKVAEFTLSLVAPKPAAATSTRGRDNPRN